MAEELSREDFRNLLSRIIQVPSEEVALSLRYETDWANSSAFGGYGSFINEIDDCRRLVEQLAFFTLWLESKAREGERIQLRDFIENKFARFEKWLASQPDPLLSDSFFTYPPWNVPRPGPQDGLWGLVFTNIPNDDEVPAEARLRFELIEAHRENPLLTRVLARGGAAAMLALVLIFGSTQVVAEVGAPACRAYYGEMIQHEYASYDKAVEKLGRRVDPRLLPSRDAAIKAYNEAASGCGSILNRYGMQLESKLFKFRTGGSSDTGAEARKPEH
jgi:hypothetical protein